jgi:hypothetical protein
VLSPEIAVMEDNKRPRIGPFKKPASYVLLAILAGGCIWFFFGTSAGHVVGAFVTQKTGAAKTVQDRLNHYGPAARMRLAPFFQQAGVPYPPRAATLVGIKSQKLLEVYSAGENGDLRFIRDFPILAASGGPGPKLREGDRQVPEGIYGIESLNPNSLYHLALRVNYPNDFDRAMAKRDGRDKLGGDIMIHGSDGSVGCLAMGDQTSEDLFVLAADAGIDKVKVILAPKDFRTDASNPPAVPQWADGLYERIRAELNALPARTARP